MATIIQVHVADLLFDEQNPRLSTPNVGQREALRTLATLQGGKLRALVEDIQTNGLNPSELTIVEEVRAGSSASVRYRVLDGNRRLTAIRALENPDSLADAVQSSVLKGIRAAHRDYQANPIQTIPCVLVADREEARHWIWLGHMGERAGAGPVDWGSDDAARFRARTERPELHTQALDRLQQRGMITPEFRRKVAVTTLKRLLEDRDVRPKLGIAWKDQTLTFEWAEDQALKGILHVATEIADGRIKVGDVYSKQQRRDYAAALPDFAGEPPANTTPPPGAPPAPAPTDAEPTVAKRTPRPRQRENLIPPDCVLNISLLRVADIETELRRLHLATYRNAVAVLFRVFLEMTADHYIGAQQLVLPDKSPCGAKMKAVADHLVQHAKLLEVQAKPVRKAAQNDSYRGPSVTTMHQWVHNPYLFTSPAELTADWDSLQPWFLAVWA